MTRLPSTMRRWVAASAIASGCLAVVNAPPAHADVPTSAVCDPNNGQSVTLLGQPGTTTFVRYQVVSPVEAYLCFNLPDKNGPNAGVLVLRGGSFTLPGLLFGSPTACPVPLPVVIVGDVVLRLSLGATATGDPAACIALNGLGISVTFVAPDVEEEPSIELWLDPGIRVFPPSY